MYTALYLNNNKIIAAVGSSGRRGIRVLKNYETFAPEGSLVNGVVMDADALTDCLRQFFKENRIPKNHVILVLNSTRLTVKMIQAPKMKPKETYAYVNRELASIQQKQDMIVGYFEEGVNEKGIRALFALCMERDFLDVYEKIFKKLGIHLKVIESGLGAVVAATRKLDYLQDKTCIIQILGETNMYSILLSKGRYIYSSSTRMFQEKGTAGFGLEVARAISGMLQFAATQLQAEPVTDVYWCGFDALNEEICREHVEQMGSSLKVEAFTGGNWIRSNREEADSLDVSVFAAAALGIPGTGTDLYRDYRLTNPGRLAKKAAQKAMVPVEIALAAGILATAGTAVWYNHVKEENRLLREYNESSAMQQMLEQYEALSERNQILNGKVEELQTTLDRLGTYPIFDRQVKDLLESRAAGLVAVQIAGYYANTGAIQLYVTADEMNDIQLFVERLEGQREFCDVEYTGYSQSAQSQLWYGNVVVYLAGPDNGKED